MSSADTDTTTGTARRFSLSPSMAKTLFIIGAMFLLAIARVAGGDKALTSVSTFNIALGIAVPIALAGLGALVSERCGVVNIGVEGMMILGAWFAGWFGYYGGPWLALVGGIVGGLVGGALHALATVTFAIDQTVSGVAINLLAPAMARFGCRVLFEGVSDGTISNSPSMKSMNKFSFPILGGGRVGSFRPGDPFGWLAKKRWFFVSDIAGLIKGFTSDLKWSTIILLLMFPLVWYLVWRTPWGLRLRSSGEKPSAADSLGINVVKMRWMGVLLSGALAGLGGAWLAIDGGAYRQGFTANRGFLGIAAMIFGNWMPLTLFLGAFLLSFPEVLRLAGSDKTPRAFVLSVAIAFGLVAYRSFRSGNKREAGVVGVIGLALLAFFLKVGKVDDKLVQSFPYLLTLIVLVFSSQRLRPPKSTGIPWIKGQSG